LANKLNMPKDMVSLIYKTGIIHDIGKINIPNEILNKVTKLNKSEVEIIRSHPITGYEIIKDLRFMSPVEKIILQHHERVNGSGYPYGLRKDEIMIEAKIIAVADVIEAMSSERPYGQAYPVQEIIEELNKNSGVLYDDSIVYASIQLLKSDKFDIYTI
jgi:putative nucleotidyltransferase with HDIG domain